MTDRDYPTAGDIFNHLGNSDEPYAFVGYGDIERAEEGFDLDGFGQMLGVAFLGIALSAEGYEESGEIDDTPHHIFQEPGDPRCIIVILGGFDEAPRAGTHFVYRQGEHGNFPRQLWLRTESDFQQNFVENE